MTGCRRCAGRSRSYQGTETDWDSFWKKFGWISERRFLLLRWWGLIRAECPGTGRDQRSRVCPLLKMRPVYPVIGLACQIIRWVCQTMQILCRIIKWYRIIHAAKPCPTTKSYRLMRVVYPATEPYRGMRPVYPATEPYPATVPSLKIQRYLEMGHCPGTCWICCRNWRWFLRRSRSRSGDRSEVLWRRRCWSTGRIRPVWRSGVWTFPGRKLPVWETALRRRLIWKGKQGISLTLIPLCWRSCLERRKYTIWG